MVVTVDVVVVVVVGVVVVVDNDDDVGGDMMGFVIGDVGFVIRLVSISFMVVVLLGLLVDLFILMKSLRCCVVIIIVVCRQRG